jgi:putative NADH-flavin reductase
MKLAIFGATGKAGVHLVEQALAAGYEVNAFTRSPHKLTVQHDKLTVVEGDVQNAERVDAAIAGVDVVLSVLGPSENKPTFAVTKGTQHILASMQAHGVKRLVVSAGAGVGDPNDEPKLINKFINIMLKLVSRHVYDDMVRAVETVRSSELDWIIVRVPMLTDSPATGDIKVGWVGKGTGPRLSRADMAAFMLAQVDDMTHVRKAPVISN